VYVASRGVWGATVDHSDNTHTHTHTKKWIITQISRLSDLENTDGLTHTHTHTHTLTVKGGFYHHLPLPSSPHFVYVLLPPCCPSVSLLTSACIYKSSVKCNSEQAAPWRWPTHSGHVSCFKHGDENPQWDTPSACFLFASVNMSVDSVLAPPFSSVSPPAVRLVSEGDCWQEEIDGIFSSQWVHTWRMGLSEKHPIQWAYLKNWNKPRGEVGSVLLLFIDVLRVTKSPNHIIYLKTNEWCCWWI